jgi:Arc/MetJ-type ribon-helix-helix transcriptional regulator
MQVSDCFPSPTQGSARPRHFAGTGTAPGLPSGPCRRPGAYSGPWKSRGLPVVGEAGQAQGQGAERLPAARTFRSYDPDVSDRKIRVTVTLEPHLAAYAERLVEAGKAPSVSAVVNDALEAERQRDQKARRLWREAAERADPDQIARMLAHVEAQAAQLPASHRYR